MLLERKVGSDLSTDLSECRKNFASRTDRKNIIRKWTKKTPYGERKKRKNSEGASAIQSPEISGGDAYIRV